MMLIRRPTVALKPGHLIFLQHIVR